MRRSVDTLLETYDSQLFERFRELGLDFTKDHAIAHALGDHTSNKPLFGFVRRHRADIPRMQQALDIALAHHAGEGHEKGVMLCLWAGANPHTQVPWLRYLGFGEVDPEDEDRHSAVEAACSGGHAPILEKLGPNPAVDDFEELYCSAANEKVIAVLLRQKLPKDAGRVIALQVARTHFRFGEYRPVEALRALFAAGVRWQEASAEEIASSRRDLLRCSDWDFADLMRLLAADDHCSKEVLIATRPNLEPPGTHEEGRPHSRVPVGSKRVRPVTPLASTGNARQVGDRAPEAQGGQGGSGSLSQGANRELAP